MWNVRKTLFERILDDMLTHTHTQHRYEFKENRNMLKAIDDASSRDVIEKTNRIERHVRWKEYAALCLKKYSQVPKQLLSTQSYQDIMQEYISGRIATTNMTTEFPDILSKNQIREERTIEIWQGLNLLLGFKVHGLSSFEDFKKCIFSVKRNETYDRLIVSILRNVLPHMIVRSVPVWEFENVTHSRNMYKLQDKSTRKSTLEHRFEAHENSLRIMQNVRLMLLQHTCWDTCMFLQSVLN